MEMFERLFRQKGDTLTRRRYSTNSLIVSTEYSFGSSSARVISHAISS